MQGLVDNLLDQCLGLHAAFAAARGVFLNPRTATLRKTASPKAHGLGTAAKLSGDFNIAQSGVCQEHDFGSQYESRWRQASARPAL